MKLLLVGNYLPDRQQSMLRFGAMLEASAKALGWEVATIAPRSSAATRSLMKRARGGVAKWVGYIDKYVFFSPRLAREVQKQAARGLNAVHVVDHSNAVYVPAHAAVPWLVTCHDLLAVRGALGEDTDCPASALGRRLQRAVVAGLSRGQGIVADSTSTLKDVNRLIPGSESQLRRVIMLGLNFPYARIDSSTAAARLGGLGGVPWNQPFVMHVGSNLPRKNKAGVLRVFARASATWPGNLVFCGAELPSDLVAAAEALGLRHRVFAVPAPDSPQLEAIYSLAHALLFPSTCEGFGWPVIEAQACGCPVVCSARTSLPEIGGDAALVHELSDEAGMAQSILSLAQPKVRTEIVQRGWKNLQRFSTQRMFSAYAEVYGELAAARPTR